MTYFGHFGMIYDRMGGGDKFLCGKFGLGWPRFYATIT